MILCFHTISARKNKHHYPDNETLSKDIFYNYKPVYLGLPAMSSNYYMNFTSDDDREFEDEWRMLKGAPHLGSIHSQR